MSWWQNPIMLDERASETIYKDKKPDREREKKQGTEWSKASQKHEYLKIFLEISPVQKEVPSSHKLHISTRTFLD